MWPIRSGVAGAMERNVETWVFSTIFRVSVCVCVCEGFPTAGQREMSVGQGQSRPHSIGERVPPCPFERWRGQILRGGNRHGFSRVPAAPALCASGDRGPGSSSQACGNVPRVPCLAEGG